TPKTFSLALNGSLELLGVLKFNAGFTVVVQRSAWRFTYDADINFFGLATLHGSGYLDSDGNFEVDLSGNFLLGSRSFGIEGGFHFHVQSGAVKDANGNILYYVFDLSGGAHVKVYAFGITLVGA